MKIKNWNKFQHFKDRNPPWIKLYRDLLNDPDWHNLDGESAKTLVMIWLLASESKDGELPSNDKIAFRLRISESQLKQKLTKLSGWLYQDDINVISERYQDDAPETETETERETEVKVDKKASTHAINFNKFWSLYPKKTGKQKCLSLWAKKKPPIEIVLKAVAWQQNIYSIKVASGEKIIDWRASESGINAKGKELNILPHDNESIKDYRRRLLQGES